MQEPSKSNFHQEFRKNIMLIAGIALTFFGVYMLYKGVTAFGIIHFSSALGEGKIESGSAGLLVMALGIIIMAVASYKNPKEHHSGSRFSGIIQKLLNCSQLFLILNFALVVFLIILILLVESIRIYLIILIGLIILVNFQAKK